MLIAQLTDPHVWSKDIDREKGFQANEHLRAAVAKLNGLNPRPDIVLITGDLTVGGEPAEYDALAEVLSQLKMPYVLTIGNHDVRANFLASVAFRNFRDENGFIQQAIDEFPVRILMLDSTSDFHHQGEFCDKRLRWLSDRLTEKPETPTLLGLHHPPFRTGIVGMDGNGPKWAKGLLAQLRTHRQIVGVVCGHIHRSIQTVVDGTLVSVCPSTTSQVSLDLDPCSSLEKHLLDGFGVSEPKAFQLHLWTGEQLVTHNVFLESFAKSISVDIKNHSEMSLGKYQNKWMYGPSHD